MSRVKDMVQMHQELQFQWLLESNGYEEWLGSIRANNEVSSSEIDEMERDFDKSLTAINHILSTPSLNNPNYTTHLGVVS